MPRLENRGIHPLTAPGLVPGVPGAGAHPLRRPARRGGLARPATRAPGSRRWSRSRGAREAAGSARRSRSSSSTRSGWSAGCRSGSRPRSSSSPSSSLRGTASPTAPRLPRRTPRLGRGGRARRRRRRGARLRARLPRPAAVRERARVRRDLSYLGQGLLSMLTPLSIFNVAWATLLGIPIGILPGLTATMGVALLVTFTYPMAPDQAILTLMCVYIGAIYGGSRTAILLNIPGTPASAATTLDGYPLARQGKAGLRHGPRDHLLGARHAGRRLLPRAPRAAARRGGAEVRLLRVLLARPLRRADLGADDRVRQPAQGLHRRHPRASSSR